MKLPSLRGSLDDVTFDDEASAAEADITFDYSSVSHLLAVSKPSMNFSEVLLCQNNAYMTCVLCL